tara:strand:- start:4341 stop:4739 length:399 start_codon:yes stop_codon:yes gene_type:complete
MKIKIAYPPNIDQIDRKFHVKGRAVIFAYGFTIYNPMDVAIESKLIEHEEVHGARQRNSGDVAEWWDLYIRSSRFRLVEEIVAHQAEYHYMLAQAANRYERRSALNITAKRLAAPLYGRLITVKEAKKVLKK